MGKIQMNVCEICHKPNCNGTIYKMSSEVCKREWLDQDMYIPWFGKEKFCKNSEDVVKRNGKFYYHWVMGHGIEDYYLLEEII